MGDQAIAVGSLDASAVTRFGIRTRSARMMRVFEVVQRVAGIELTVLLFGETGTGKELIARALHACGRRAAAPLISVNCGALPEQLAESELFGHERGAFTGAERTTIGQIEAATGGTLFLDEINSLPASVQPKLLRFLEHGELSRVGRARPTTADVRVVSACNADPETLVAMGQLRRDVYERLNVLRINIPALRERAEDIPLLVAQFLEEDPLSRQLDVRRVSPRVLDQLTSYAWPGNVRELWNVLRRSLVFGTQHGTLVEIDTFMPPVAVTASRSVSSVAGELPRFRAWIKERESEYLEELARRHQTASARARASGLPERTLSRKLRRVLRDIGLSGVPLPPENGIVPSVGDGSR